LASFPDWRYGFSNEAIFEERVALGDGVGDVLRRLVGPREQPLAVAQVGLGGARDLSITRAASTGFWATAVSSESITASVPS